MQLQREPRLETTKLDRLLDEGPEKEPDVVHNKKQRTSSPILVTLTINLLHASD